MFGYVKPYKPELRVRELETYKAVYCGLCRELGRAYGPLSRLTLSYDFAFLALLEMAITPGSPEFCQKRCAAHPLRRKSTCVHSPALESSAAAAMILLYYKLRDDLADRGFFKKLAAALIYPVAAAARRRALRRSDKERLLDEAAADMMREQARLEAEGCSSADRAAEPTAKFLERALSLLSEDGEQRRVLARFGYLFGRYIYLCDAADDLDDDRKKGAYNPFLYGEDTAGRLARARGSLYSTIAELCAALELLKIYRYKEILDNVAYLGLKAEAGRITEKRSGDPE